MRVLLLDPAVPIKVDRIAAGFDNPVFAASAPGDQDRLFVAEKNTGRIGIVDLRTNQVAAQAFLDIDQSDLGAGLERGLLGFAFHPGFAANGKVYLNLTNEAGDTEIWEMTRSAGNPLQADPASTRVLLTIDRLTGGALHNGGWMGFGPDGFLYIASGDSGGVGDRENAAQNVNDLRGKMLRIDVDHQDPGLQYAIPAGNPFANEVFAFGLRNPWRASFDRGTGDFYIGDPGQSAREEINYLPANAGAGTNFGWDVMEGTLPTVYAGPGSLPANHPSFRAPLLEYTYGSGELQGFAVIGGYVYRGPGGMQGQYFFADNVSDHVWTTKVVDGKASDFVQRDDELVVTGGTLDDIVSFAEDAQSRLYALGLDGELFRFSPDPEPALPVAASSSGDEGGGDSGIGAMAVAAAAALFLGIWFF